MKTILIIMIGLSSLLYSGDTNSSFQKDKRIKQQIQKEIEKEKKFAKEQRFYNIYEYDFKGAEVNPDSLKSVPEIEVLDDFDMDDVYD